MKSSVFFITTTQGGDIFIVGNIMEVFTKFLLPKKWPGFFPVDSGNNPQFILERKEKPRSQGKHLKYRETD